MIIGGWAGYNFGDIADLTRFDFFTKDRVVLLYGIIGAVMFLAPGYAKKKGQLKGVPTAIFSALATYCLGVAITLYREG